jgi:hypothetical protein
LEAGEIIEPDSTENDSSSAVETSDAAELEEKRNAS